MLGLRSSSSFLPHAGGASATFYHPVPGPTKQAFQMSEAETWLMKLPCKWPGWLVRSGTTVCLKGSSSQELETMGDATQLQTWHVIGKIVVF